MLKRIAPMLLVAAMLVAAGAGVMLWTTPTQAAPAAVPIALNGTQAVLTPTGSITAGAYIVQLALGCGCHFNGPLAGLAGGDDFSGPYGALFARNITPDPLTGIGNYTEAQLETVLRTGKRPNGEQLFPVMPYMHFSQIAEDDMDDLTSFLLYGQAPLSNTVPPRALLAEPDPFTPTAPIATAPVSGVARGEYIVDVLGDCTGCHGPNLGGTPGFAPNITSDPDYGIGILTTGQLSATLHTGVRAEISGSLRFNGDPIGSVMALIIQTAISNWTPGDVTAVAEYLKSVPAVGNQPPLFDGAPTTQATVQTGYVYTANVADFDVFDTISVTAPTLPTWLTLGPTNTSPRPLVGGAVLSGTPALDDVGAHPVVLVVTDAAGLSSTQAFTITVINDPTGLDPEASPAEQRKLYLPGVLH
jgi:mono/diheme cytochrome c family protein